jgi:hypothetical protein
LNTSILLAFIADQRKAKHIVADRLGIIVDLPSQHWVDRYPEIICKYNSQPFADVFTPHGHGLELKIGDFYIDYDYSRTGRPDGFDAWRIFVYLMAGQYDNNGPDKHFFDRVLQWIDQLAKSGKLIEEDYLYYLRTPMNQGV